MLRRPSAHAAASPSPCSSSRRLTGPRPVRHSASTALALSQSLATFSLSPSGDAPGPRPAAPGRAPWRPPGLRRPRWLPPGRSRARCRPRAAGGPGACAQTACGRCAQSPTRAPPARAHKPTASRRAWQCCSGRGAARRQGRRPHKAGTARAPRLHVRQRKAARGRPRRLRVQDHILHQLPAAHDRAERVPLVLPLLHAALPELLQRLIGRCYGLVVSGILGGYHRTVLHAGH